MTTEAVIETWRGPQNRLEVARVPEPVVPNVEKRLFALVRYLDSVLEPDDVANIVAMVAGVVHQISLGAKLEFVALIRRRALKTKLKANEHDDLVAAAELEDLAQDLDQLVLNEAGKG